LKAQLDRAVEQKVQKRLLKVFPFSIFLRGLMIVFLIEYEDAWEAEEEEKKVFVCL